MPRFHLGWHSKSLLHVPRPLIPSTPRGPWNVNLTTTCVLTWNQGFIPFLGYHHVLMILIAVAIILLCKPFIHFSMFTHVINIRL